LLLIFLFPFNNGPFFSFLSNCVWLLQWIVCQEIFVRLFLICLGLAWIPMVSAESDFDKFPDITFKVFSNFVQQQFGRDVTLATVLTILFSLTSNPDLLELHACQQHPRAQGEIRQSLSGWIKVLSLALHDQLGAAAVDTLTPMDEHPTESVVSFLAAKLDGLSKLLGLDPYQRQAEERKLKPIDEKDIAPVCILCPVSAECETASCQSRAIHKYTRDRDLSYVNLVEGAGRENRALVVAGQCTKCKTIYHADHEHSVHEGKELKLYLNSACYLKVGQKTWVDRTFSNAVLNGMYNFHASTSAFMEFWNMSFGSSQILSRRHIWQAFVQESIRRIAGASGKELELPENLSIDEVTQQAYAMLGENGVIRCAEGHVCEECSHDHKASASVIGGVEDPAAVVGVDENQAVPAFTGQPESLTIGNDRMDVDNPSEDSHTKAPVHMVVMDGIVIGPKHCAIEDCTADLVNYQTGVYCHEHETLYGNMCHMVDCTSPKFDGTLTCVQHQREWNSYKVWFGCSNLLGVQRLLRRSEEEGLPWVPVSEHTVQPHD
jgi:hypothetical protein